MSFADHFSSLAGQYAAYRPSYPAALFAWLAGIVPDHELAWDCACGSGQASVGLTRYFARVTATDASEAQLAEAVPHPKIDYQVARADASKLADQSADLVTVAQAIHWFPLDRFYNEARRVLKPRGVLAAWTYDLLSVDDAAITERITHFHKHVVGPYWPPERDYVVRGYRTLPFPFEHEIAAPDFCMEIAWDLPHLLGYFRSWSATKNFKSAHGVDPVDELTKELTLLWGDATIPKQIHLPVYMRVGRV